MVGSEMRVYQLHLGEKLPEPTHRGEETPETLYQFAAEVFIYPSGSSRGMLQNPVTAVAIKIRRGRYSIWESRSRIDLFFAGDYWSLVEGTRFEALKKFAVKLK